MKKGRRSKRCMKALFLTLLYDGDNNGGHTARMATAKALKNILGYKNFDIGLSELDNWDWECNVAIRTKKYSGSLSKVKNLIQGNITQRSNKDISEIVNIINKEKYDVVLFGSSETGKLIYEIKHRCNVKTITFYHDILADLLRKKIQEKTNLKMLPVWLAQRRAEELDSQYTDFAIVFHGRDAELLKKYWNRKADAIIPTLMADNLKEIDYKASNRNKEPLHLLFVGAYNWKANTDAIYWFCDNVMNKLQEYNIIFNIAGFQTENLVNDGLLERCMNANVVGTVDDLSKIYKHVDVVVEPIIQGSGMKTKTVEALMYGKEIIGTEEALIGFDMLANNICYTAEDFIKKIIEYEKNRPLRFVNKNRQAYINNFSVKAIEKKLEVVLQQFS